MTGLLRLPDLKKWSCSDMYFAPWPARFGHSGLVVLLPVMPWHAPQAAALAAPASAVPSASADRLRPRPAMAARRRNTFMLEAPLSVVLVRNVAAPAGRRRAA